MIELLATFAVDLAKGATLVGGSLALPVLLLVLFTRSCYDR